MSQTVSIVETTAPCSLAGGNCNSINPDPSPLALREGVYICVFIGLNIIFLCFGRGLYLLGPAEVCKEHVGLTGLLGPESLKAVLGCGHLRSALLQAFDWIENIMCSHPSVQCASLLKACPVACFVALLACIFLQGSGSTKPLPSVLCTKSP